MFANGSDVDPNVERSIEVCTSDLFRVWEGFDGDNNVEPWVLIDERSIVVVTSELFRVWEGFEDENNVEPWVLIVERSIVVLVRVKF